MDMDADKIRDARWKTEIAGRLDVLERRLGTSPTNVASPKLSPGADQSSEVAALKAELAGFAADLDTVEQALARVETALAALNAAK